MKNGTLRPGDYVCHTGSAEYVVDMQPGDCQIDYDLRADGYMRSYLGCGDKVIPLGSGEHVFGRLFVADLKWLMICCDPATKLALSVFQVPRTISDKLDLTPRAVIIPEPPRVDMRAMVDRIVAQKMEDVYGPGKQEIDLGEIMEQLPDDMDEEFGVGFMELDEETMDMFEDTKRFKNERRAAEEKARKEAGLKDQTTTEVKSAKEKKMVAPKPKKEQEEEVEGST